MACAERALHIPDHLPANEQARTNTVRVDKNEGGVAIQHRRSANPARSIRSQPPLPLQIRLAATLV